MSSNIILRGAMAVGLAYATLGGFLASQTSAGFPFCGPCLDQTGCSACCPECNHCCRLEAEMVDEDIPCFDVESKLICIPRVVFPWQKKKCLSCDSCDGRGCTNCVHNGARVRRICVLKTDKIKCPKCKYTWTPERTCNGCDGGCDGCCDGGCDTSIPMSWTNKPSKSQSIVKSLLRPEAKSQAGSTAKQDAEMQSVVQTSGESTADGSTQIQQVEATEIDSKTMSPSRFLPRTPADAPVYAAPVPELVYGD